MDGGERRMSRLSRGPRNSVSDRPGRLKLLLRRQRRLLRPAAWIALASLAVLLVGVLLRSVAPGGPFTTFRERIGGATAFAGLRVHEIRIEGRANTPEPLLRAALGVNRGDPILGFSLEAARERIQTLSWIKHATVERRLPGTVVVNIEERRPFAIWQNNGKFVLIDRAGQIVTHEDVANFRSLPLVVGAGAPPAAAVLLDALTARPSLRGRVTAAVRVGERRWNLMMNNGINVMLPEGHEAAALDRLIQLQHDHELLDRPLAAIDMRLPDRLVVRSKPTDAADQQPAKKQT
jgi:cell division protein FtsQ